MTWFLAGSSSFSWRGLAGLGGNHLATLPLTCTPLIRAGKTVLPILWFSSKFGLVFLQILFCGLLFFQILWHFCCFNVLLKAYWVCFCENLLILVLFFRICLHAFLFNFLVNFLFCWIFLPTAVGLVFRLNHLFLAWFSNLLACF